MKAVFALFVIVAIIGMAMAGVHHYRIDNGQAAPTVVADSAQHHKGGFFDAVASGINGILGG